MTGRRYALAPTKTPAHTGGDDRPTPACAGNPEPYDLLMDYISGPIFRYALDQAKATCATCPLFATCLTEHRDEQWAKAVLGVELRKEPKQRDFCGTRKGYKYHYANGEHYCEDCQRWNREHVRSTAAKRRGAA